MGTALRVAYAAERLPYSTHTVENERTRVQWGAGLHVAERQRVDASAYEQWVGRWSRLFVPTVFAEAEASAGDRVLDVATGPGQATALALSLVGPTGLVVGVDIAPAMLDTACARFIGQRFRAAAMDGQAFGFP
jgi:SAM-dependent methyltransferase